MSNPWDTPEYWAEFSLIDFGEELHKRMEELGMNRSQLAEKMGCSKAYVTQALSGDGNFTLKTMAKFASAVGCRVHIAMVPKKARATTTATLPESLEGDA